jgi:uncharacterized membrane protein
MTPDWMSLGAFCAALGSGLIAGTFFASSSFIMGALARLPAEQGVAAMQSINIVVINPMFLGVFLGTAILSALLAVAELLGWGGMASTWLLAGCAAYIGGCLLVTMVCNVPMNDALARLTAASPEAAQYWPEYVSGWTFWNHVRTAASLVAAVCFIIAMR